SSDLYHSTTRAMLAGGHQRLLQSGGGSDEAIPLHVRRQWPFQQDFPPRALAQYRKMNRIQKTIHKQKPALHSFIQEPAHRFAHFRKQSAVMRGGHPLHQQKIPSRGKMHMDKTRLGKISRQFILQPRFPFQQIGVAQFVRKSKTPEKLAEQLRHGLPLTPKQQKSS
ncbi:MAG: hypothetical protein LBH94_01360, partial [Deltaproteobacteria bacterium]|nr:hypothetical protein [Deltaproteobacteria bacterium]